MVEINRTRNKNHTWSEEEICYLKNNFENMRYQDIGKNLGLPESCIKNQTKKLGLKKPQRTLRDVSGKRKGNIVCIGRNSDNREYFDCVCEKCGIKLVLKSEFFNTSRNRKYTTSYCNCKRTRTARTDIGEIKGWFIGKIARNAKSRSMEFTVTAEYLYKILQKQNGICPYSGELLTFANSEKERKYQTASLDRIDSSLGYVENNVQWVHKRVNSMKNDMSENEFIEFVVKIFNHTKKEEYEKN